CASLHPRRAAPDQILRSGLRLHPPKERRVAHHRRGDLRVVEGEAALIAHATSPRRRERRRRTSEAARRASGASNAAENATVMPAASRLAARTRKNVANAKSPASSPRSTSRAAAGPCRAWAKIVRIAA